MRVLGIDPGSHHLGWGFVDVQGSRLSHVASGTLHAPPGELVTRLCYLGSQLEVLLLAHGAAAAAVEGVFHARNSRSALILGHARGTVLYCLGRRDIPVFEYTPGQIKQANTGAGAAQKDQVRTMVCMILGLQGGEMGYDTSDALAAALCHVQHADRLDRRAVATQSGRNAAFVQPLANAKRRPQRP
jgi:crossover junction endodeoxyribonuclease RuvC